LLSKYRKASRRGLTNEMNEALNTPGFLLTTLAARPDLKGLSDWELISQYPVLAQAAIILRLAGVVCGIYLCWRYFVTRGNGAVINVSPPAWARQGLQLAVVALLAAILSDALVFLALAGPKASFSSRTLTGIIIMRLVILAAIILYLRHAQLNWRWTNSRATRAITAGAIFYLAVLPLVDILVWLTTTLVRATGLPLTPQPIAELLVTSLSSGGVWLVVALAVVIAPLFEEIIFRGLAYPALKQRWGTVPALVLVSALFALTHLHLPSFGPLFVLGVGLGLAYESTGSLLASITMHALFNAVNVGMLLYIRSHS
jgi:membrane protease YdiL (CAAX protease family)